MPLFSYICADGHETEELEDEARSWIRCPKCGKRAKRDWSSVGIRFHGPGFHSTDYKKKPKAKEEKSRSKKNKN